jgi:transposase InsO family protein
MQLKRDRTTFFGLRIDPDKWGQGRSATGPSPSVRWGGAARWIVCPGHPHRWGGPRPHKAEAAGFFADQGVRIERILTDRHNSYRLSRSFEEAVRRIGARHKLTRGYRPQTNGKAERFIRTMLAEWAYVRLYRSNEQRLRALPAWLDFYNSRRPHTALGGLSPSSRLSTT